MTVMETTDVGKRGIVMVSGIEMVIDTTVTLVIAGLATEMEDHQSQRRRKASTSCSQQRSLSTADYQD